MKIAGILCVCFVLMIACDKKEVSGVGESQFFSLENYIDAYLEERGNIMKVDKIVKRNGEIEDMFSFPEYDLTDDLKAFQKADITAPSLSDRYDVESNEGTTDNSTYTIYKSAHPETETKRMHIGYYKEDVDSISVHRVFQSVISSIKQELIFVPDQYYSMRSVLTDKISGKHTDLTVEVRFTN